MFVGLALCTSVAFAQTQPLTRAAKAALEQTSVKFSEVKSMPVDYKASIFTKEDGADTITTFTFAPNAMTGVVCGLNAVVAATDYINDTLVGDSKHDLTLEKDVWTRIANTAWLDANYATEYSGAARFFALSGLKSRMDTANNPGTQDDGFMFLSLCEQPSVDGNFNTYFQLPTVNKNSNTLLVEVRLTQAYRKYYDYCYIDYKLGNNWYATEINVAGVDVAVTAWAPYKASFALPQALLTDSRNTSGEINLRFRLFCDGVRGNAYGYAWAVDNVAVVSITQADRWTLTSPHAFDGLYGTLPKGMSVPVSYGLNAYNIGIANLTDAKLTLSAGTNPNNFQTVATGTGRTLPAGDVSRPFGVYIDERGFIPYLDTTPDYYLQAWIGMSSNYGNQGALVDGYRGRSLPTATAGANYYTITATAGNDANSHTLSTKTDTVLYTVSDYLEVVDANTDNRIEGYRWGRDNGLIPSYSIFCTQFTDDGYVTQDTATEHYIRAGYGVHMRYTTGATVPTDWRFRGLEIVPSTRIKGSTMAGTTIIPVLYKEVYSGEGDDMTLSWQRVPCGIDNQAFEVQASHANNLPTGYILPEDDYKAFDILFPNQPALEPNTAYRVGYILNTDGKFAAASMQTYYKNTDTTTQRYNADPITAPYYNQNMEPPTYLDIIVSDPEGPNTQSVYGWNVDAWPMIRPIVGPEMEIPSVTLTVDCTNNRDSAGTTIGSYVEFGGDSLCNYSVSLPIGSSQYFYIVPIGDHSVISEVTLNGQVLRPYDDETEEGELIANQYNVINEDNGLVLLERVYYTLYMGDVPNENMVLSFKTIYKEHRGVGIDPVAPEATMTLAPNPATSTVKLNLSGITGMVNCNIIDMSGRVVYNANINAESENIISLNEIPAGAYFVRVTNNTFSKIEKLIVR